MSNSTSSTDKRARRPRQARQDGRQMAARATVVSLRPSAPESALSDEQRYLCVWLAQRVDRATLQPLRWHECALVATQADQRMVRRLLALALSQRLDIWQVRRMAA